MALVNEKQLSLLANTVRGLAIDAIQKANSGHPGLPLGCADLGALLYGRVLNHNPQDPTWPNRDRFVLSAGHGSMFLYGLLHCTGYKVSLEDITQFRQLGSKTPGHPEFGLTDGVETTTGPLGAGFATAVGMAMAETMLASRFNTPTHKIVDHMTYVLAGDGCLMEGVSAEAASLAGHLGLGKLVAFYDSNRITIEGDTDLAFTENVEQRFLAYGWQVLRASGYDYNSLQGAIIEAKAMTSKPTIIIVDTIIGYGSPNKAGSHEVHGAALGVDEVKATKVALGLDPEKHFFVPQELTTLVSQLQGTWSQNQAVWTELYQSWRATNPSLAIEWDQAWKGGDLGGISWPSFEKGSKLATRSASGQCLQAIAKALPSLVGGSADLAPSNNTELKGLGHYQASSPGGRTIHFGVREHAMGNVVNGIVLHGGLKAFGATFLVFADYMRPSIRLAAIMKIPSVFVFTHDSFWVGEDGPTHQPIEHLASLRAIPGLEVLRPADGEETALAWELTLQKGFGSHHVANPGTRIKASSSFTPASGPAVLSLTRQNLVLLEKPEGWKDDVRKFGAWLALGGEFASQVSDVILATGSEVALAVEAAKKLNAEGKKIKVISIPSMERYRLARATKILPQELDFDGARVWAVEAGHYFSWAGLVPEERFLGVCRFGESGPGEKVAGHFSLDVQGVYELVKG